MRCVLQALREKVRTKEIWVVGANRFRNPDDDLPTDFEQNRATYYNALHQGVTIFFRARHTLSPVLATSNIRSIKKERHCRFYSLLFSSSTRQAGGHKDFGAALGYGG